MARPGEPSGARAARAAPLLWAAVGLGALARVVLLLQKPLWADEIFTLTLARRSLAGLLASLAVDSGPPLHYLLAKAVLLPFPLPGRGDLLVRALSLAASLLHVPLLLKVARRLGEPALGLRAAALFALFPLAIDYAAEGRAYAVASLFVLLAFERALALRDEPKTATAVALTLASTAAVLTHYLAVFPVAGLAWLLVKADRRARLALLASGAAATLLAAAWVPVALSQPRASMAWALGTPRPSAISHFLVNVLVGLAPPARLLPLFLGLALLAALGIGIAWRGERAEPAGVLAVALTALLLASLAAGALVLPERTALLFLPVVALLLARRSPLAAGSALVSTVVAVLVLLPASTGPSPGESLAELLLPVVRRGGRIAAGGLWGPELDYRLRRAGAADVVVLFPSDVALHPGWYREEPGEEARYAAEARELVASPDRPQIWVLPAGARSSQALRDALAPLGPRRLLASPFAEVLSVQTATRISAP